MTRSLESSLFSAENPFLERFFMSVSNKLLLMADFIGKKSPFDY
jgi:hypothetical protein